MRIAEEGYIGWSGAKRKTLISMFGSLRPEIKGINPIAVEFPKELKKPIFIHCLLAVLIALVMGACRRSAPPIVFLSDFGLEDGAVSAMKGVALEVDSDLRLFDLTHEIEPYNIWEAAYRLHQAAVFWPSGTVFVSVVDPGVGTDRKSVVMKSKTGHFFVSPDNGTLTHVAEYMGVAEVRQINEEINRRKESGQSYTFHGRDVYAFTAARLASGAISFEEIGKKLHDVERLPYQKAQLVGGSINGNIPVLDKRYGNVWTNIPIDLLNELSLKPGDSLNVAIFLTDSLVHKQRLVYANTFADVPSQHPVAYVNSLLNMSFALNQGSFADSFKISSGPTWMVVIDP